MYFMTFTLAVIISFANLTFAGDQINCKGGFGCKFIGSKRPMAQTLTGYINQGIDSNRAYHDGEKIACQKFHSLGFDSHVCAFLQRTNGASGAVIRSMAHWIPAHRCRACGSVPFYFSLDNNIGNGMLTYNIVSKGACDDGLC